MGVNKAEHGVEDHLINKIAELDRQLTELKTRVQPIGADGITILETSTLLTSTTNIAAGGWGFWGIITTPAVHIFTLMNFEITMYIDGTTSNDRFPAGSNLTSGMKNCRFEWWEDWEGTDPVTGVTKVYLRAENGDSVPHNFAFRFISALPKMPTGAA